MARSTVMSQPAGSARSQRSHEPRTLATALLAPTRGGLRRRSGADAARLALALLLLVAMGALYGTSAYIFGAVVGWIYPVPHALSWLVTSLWLVSSLGIVLLIISVILLARQFEIVRDIAEAAVLAWLGCLVIRLALGSQLGLSSTSDVTWRGIDLGFPALLLALTAGVSLAAKPYLSRAMQRVLLANLALLVITGFLYGAGLPFSLVGGLAVGWAAAAGIHLLFGTPIPVPAAAEVNNLLQDLRITAGSARAVPYQQWGLTRFTAIDESGRTLRIALYSRDARQSQLSAKVYRSLIYRRDAAPFALTRQQQIEHEAYITLLAQRAAPGHTAELVVTDILGASDDAVVVTATHAGQLLHELLDAGRAPSAAALSSLVKGVSLLREAGIAHGSVDFDHVVVDGDTAVLVNFDAGAGNAGPDVLSRDVAAVLVTGTLATDVDTAVAAVASGLGGPALAHALPLLQNAALSPTLTTALHHSKHHGLLKELRQKGADAAGVPVPEVEQLGRVNVGRLLAAVGSLVGVWALVGVLVNAAHSSSTIGRADWPWVIATAVISSLTFPCAAYATRGTVPAHLPLWPLVLFQLASTFTILMFAGASTAARIRFFQRQGITATVAVGSGVLASATSWLVTGILFVVSLPFALGQIDLQTIVTDSGIGRSHVNWSLIVVVLAAVIVLIALVVLVAFKVPKSRAAIDEKVRPKYHEMKAGLSDFTHQPRRLLETFGGQVGAQLVTALALVTALEAFAEQRSVAVALVVVILASTLGMVVPVPGGMGVIESVTILGLKASGVPTGPAVAAVFIQRLFTGYLPPLTGWFSLMALRHMDYL